MKHKIETIFQSCVKSHSENASGSVARIRLYDTTLTASEVADLDRLPASIPEPLTLLGVSTAIGFGSFFKRQLAKKQK